MTMPAIAPPDMDLDVEDVDDAEAELALEAVDEDEEVVVMLEKPAVDCVVEAVVAVTAIKLRGLKVYELADGLAEDNEEYNEVNDPLLMFVRVSCAEAQQMFIWPAVCVQISLQRLSVSSSSDFMVHYGPPVKAAP